MALVTIYGFKQNGQLVYVGQTYNLSLRLHGHKQTRKLTGIACRENCVVLRTCQARSAIRLERQIILALKRRGQAQLNRQILNVSAKRVRQNGRHVSSDQGHTWPSISEAGRFFGYASMEGFKGALKRNDGVIEHKGKVHKIIVS